jgi:hypothetical protein
MEVDKLIPDEVPQLRCRLFCCSRGPNWYFALLAAIRLAAFR